RPVASCGDGTWGSIPTGPSTQYVNANSQSVTHDGTKAHPWTTIQGAVEAATDGAVVAVAEGKYAELVRISGKRGQVWGRCPSLGEVDGPEGVASVLVTKVADGSEVHGLALTGSMVGVGISGNESIVLDSLWIHDTSANGLLVEDYLGPASATVSGSLIE